MSQATLVEPSKLLWVWDGSELSQKTLELYKAPHEYWYQESGREYKTYDPYYVAEDKFDLIDRIKPMFEQAKKNLEAQLDKVHKDLNTLIKA